MTLDATIGTDQQVTATEGSLLVVAVVNFNSSSLRMDGLPVFILTRCACRMGVQISSLGSKLRRRSQSTMKPRLDGLVLMTVATFRACKRALIDSRNIAIWLPRGDDWFNTADVPCSKS